MVLQVKEKIIQQTAVTVDIIPTTVNVSLKIMYEFDSLTVDEIVELIKYDMNHTIFGNFSTSNRPRLTIFESKSMCSIDIELDLGICIMSIVVVISREHPSIFLIL